MKGFVLLALLALTLSTVKAQNKQQLLVKSEEILSAGDTTAAVKSFQYILKIYPRSYTACLRLAEIYSHQGDHQNAVQYCNIALDITDEYINKATLDLQKTSNTLTTEAFQKQKDQLRTFKVNKADVHHLKGLIRQKQNRLIDAQFEFKRALELNPKDIDTRVDLALSLTEFGKINEAKRLLYSAIRDDSTYAKPHFNLANLYYKIQEYDSASLLYKQVIDISPDFKWPYLYMGYIYTQNEKYSDALKSYTKYLNIDSLSEEVYYRRAVIKVELGMWQEALSDWGVVIKMNPLNDEAWRSRGLTYFQLQDYDSAIINFSEALRLKPKQNYTIINRGYSYYLSNQPKKALDDLNQGVAELPKYYFGYYFRALVHIQMRKKKAACEDLEMAISLGMPENEIDTLLVKKCKKN